MPRTPLQGHYLARRRCAGRRTAFPIDRRLHSSGSRADRYPTSPRPGRADVGAAASGEPRNHWIPEVRDRNDSDPTEESLAAGRRPARARAGFTLSPSARARGEAGCAGFTFIEVVIATVILSVAALVAFPTMLSFFQLSDTAHEENVATHDLMAATEDILCTPYALVTTTYAPGQAIPKYTRLHLRDELITVQYDDPAADPLIISITASWSDSRGRPRQETYRCVRTR